MLRQFFEPSKTDNLNPSARFAPAMTRLHWQQRGFPSSGTTLTAAEEETEQLSSEPLTEQVIENNVNGRVEGDEEVSDLVQGVESDLLEGCRIVNERPDDAGDESRSLADEENDGDADQHNGCVVSRPQGDALLVAPSGGHADVVDEEGVEDDEEEQRKGADE